MIYRPRLVLFLKVKAHMTAEDVANGQVSAFDWEGNAPADALAAA